MKSFIITTALLSVFASVYGGNPIKKDFGMADPHAYVFNDKVYLFTTRDIDPKAKKFVMPEWNIFSSDNLVEWKHERTILPAETYMGKSDNCWATETVHKNGKYYFYFSNANINTGVMVADRPEGPYTDALRRPLLPKSLTKGKEYDPTVIVNDDNNAYIVFGHYSKDYPDLRYFIAKLSDDMISLAEQPRILEINGEKNVLGSNDKPNLHKRNGLYYLSAGSHYAISKNVYGPYERVGNSGNGQYGLDGKAHGNYFKWKNQWFHTWCNFHLGKETAYFRESYISYLHYRDNGEMVTDVVLLNKHFENGVGQYSADWDKVEAEWFMEASRESMKKEIPGGFGITSMKSGEYLCYPNMKNLGNKKTVDFRLKVLGKGEIEIRDKSPMGRLLGCLKLSDPMVKPGFINITTSIDAKNASSVCLVFKGGSDFCTIDWFGFK